VVRPGDRDQRRRLGERDRGLGENDEVAEEAARRDIELVILPTHRAIEELARDRKGTNAILHRTC
jgi:hypothetical protein